MQTIANRFKDGDRVRVIANRPEHVDSLFWCDDMDEYCGDIGVVKSIGTHGGRVSE